MAALASAAAPGLAVAGVRDGNEASASDAALGISRAVIQDNAGRLYDVVAAEGDKAKRRVRERVVAARTLGRAKEPAGLSFAVERVLKYVTGEGDDNPTDGAALVILQHREGVAKPLDTLTVDECSSVGTAIGAIHRMRGTFLMDEAYPAYTTRQIHDQLVAWIERLKRAGHVPAEITTSWSRIIATDGMWDFATCPVHGGFEDGDLLFDRSGLTAVYHWQSMQINDPARDLAWIFAKLDDRHRNAVIAAYGRMMGSKLDDLIMLRANLWLQMEQVGDFVSAIDRADNAKIIQFKAQVERLAHQLIMMSAASGEPSSPAPAPTDRSAGDDRHPSTITVGTLLHEDSRTRAPDSEIRPRTPRVPTMPDVPVANVFNDPTEIVTPDSETATIVLPAQSFTADATGISGKIAKVDGPAAGSDTSTGTSTATAAAAAATATPKA
nr:phosphotransferase [Bifidobacterium avesanii]